MSALVPTLLPRPRKRDLLSISDIADELPALLRRAEEWKRDRRRGLPLCPLRDLAVAMVFEKPSTRTRSSFELAITELGGHAVYLPASEMQLGRGETVADTARVLSRYYDGIVYRANRWQSEEELARGASVPVINALDDREHPCQVVADLLTLSERWHRRFAGRTLAYVGDGNNVLRSLVLGCAAVGLDLAAAIPEGYRPTDEFLARARTLAHTTGAALHIVTDPRDAVREADAIYTDVWVSMGDEAQAAARTRAFHGYTIDDALLDAARPGAFALHDLPAHRGLEITDSVMDGSRQAIWDQAENRLHAQKAILELLLAPVSGPGPEGVG
jgi:ornithine carbamoyltransferase